MKRVPIPSLVIAALLVVVLVAYAVTFQIRFSQVGVRVLLGKADESSVVRAAGWHWKWPWPIESVDRFDRRYQVLDTPDTEIKTSDGKNIIIGCFAVWRIKDPLVFKIRGENERRAEELLRDRINETRSAVIGNHNMADFVNLDVQQLDRGYNEIEQQMLSQVAPGIEKDFGVELARIGIRRISLPEDVSQKVFESMIQQRETTATRYREEGAARAKTITAEANSARDQILAFAKRKAQEIESAGYWAAAKTFEQINDSEDKDLFIFLRRLDALRASLQSGTTIFLDSREALFKAFNEPPTTQPAEQ